MTSSAAASRCPNPNPMASASENGPRGTIVNVSGTVPPVGGRRGDRRCVTGIWRPVLPRTLSPGSDIPARGTVRRALVAQARPQRENPLYRGTERRLVQGHVLVAPGQRDPRL